MPSKVLKIGGDTRDLEKSLIDFSKSVKGISKKSKLDILTPDTKKILKGELNQKLKELNDRTETIAKSAAKYAMAIKKGNLSTDDEIRKKIRLLQLTKALTKVTKERADIQATSSSLKGTGPGGRLLETARGMPGIGGILGTVGKFLKSPMGLAVGGLGIAGFAAAKFAGRGFRQMESTTPERLALRARGVSDLDVTDRRFAQVGLNTEDVIRRRRQAIDVFGKQGATQEAIRRRATFERGVGVDPGTLLQAGGQIRAGIGGIEAQKSVMKLQAATLASDIEDALGPYLETAANMLTEINRDGMGLDTEALSMLNSLNKLTSGQTERMGKMIMGLNDTMKSSSGEVNMLFQTAALRAGFGGGTIGGAQAIVQEGLFGLDIGKMKGASPETMEVLKNLGFGVENFTPKLITGILDTINANMGVTEEQIAKMSPKRREQYKIQQAMVGQQIGLGPTIAQSMGVIDLMKKAKTAAPKEREAIEERIKKLRGEKPEESFKHLGDIRNSAEGQLNELKVHTSLLATMAGVSAAQLVIFKREFEVGLAETVTPGGKTKGVAGFTPRSLGGMFGTSGLISAPENMPRNKVIPKPQIELDKEKKAEAPAFVIKELAVILKEIEKNTKNQKKSSR